MKRATQNLKIPNLKILKLLQNASEAQNLKMFKNLVLACLFALMLDSSLQASTNPITDTSKHIYHPQNRDELVELLRDENIKLDTIDTSKITDMGFLFANTSDKICKTAAQGVEPYTQNCKNTASKRKDFSGIETMNNMFNIAESFNQPLNSWNVGNVTKMGGMFFEAKAFNQPLDKWNVSKVVDMNSMFAWAVSFNQNLESWDVSNVADMSSMFFQASNFKQPLNNWNVSNVTNMSYMFSFATSFNQPLDKWDVSNVKDMDYMFSFAISFNQNLDSWNVDKDAKRERIFDYSPLKFNVPKWYQR